MMKFTKDHEWLRSEGDVATVGITSFAQEKLGDLVFVELPSIGAKFAMGEVAATVESVKAASDVYAPVGGEVVAINDRLAGEPGLVNSAPTGDGWLFKLKIANSAELAQLFDEAAYQKLTAEAQ
jgi:glycine cleavage system H protein